MPKLCIPKERLTGCLASTQIINSDRIQTDYGVVCLCNTRIVLIYSRRSNNSFNSEDDIQQQQLVNNPRAVASWKDLFEDSVRDSPELLLGRVSYIFYL